MGASRLQEVMTGQAASGDRMGCHGLGSRSLLASVRPSVEPWCFHSSLQAEEALKDVSLYSREEWAEMGDGEKVRYPNVKSNFEVLLSLGFRAPPPAFVCHHRHTTELQQEDPEDLDEEWTPRQQGKGQEEPELRS